jgi:hypothetical protein
MECVQIYRTFYYILLFDKGKFIFVFVIILYSKTSILAVGPTQHSVQWVRGFLAGIKAVGA